MSSTTDAHQDRANSKRASESRENSRKKQAPPPGAAAENWIRSLHDTVAKRERPAAKAKQSLNELASLRWGAPEAACRQGFSEGIQRLQACLASDGAAHGKTAAEIESWLTEALNRDFDAAFCLECLAWCHGLPDLSRLLPEGLWCELLAFLHGLAEDGPSLSLARQPLERQLLAGELPLTLAALFPEAFACRRLAIRGRRCVADGLRELLDGEGLPECHNLPLMRPLLACWTRCGRLGERLSRATFDRPAQDRYEWLVRQSVCLSRSCGQPPLSTLSESDSPMELLSAAVELSEDADDLAIARSCLPNAKLGRATKSLEQSKLPMPGVYSEWSEIAVLRPDWSATSPHLTVAFGDRRLQMELRNAAEVLCTGRCDPKIVVNGARLEAASDWQEVCWCSDKDVDYLELEMDLTENRRVQRQLLLARKERFLLLADAVLGDRSGALYYECALPLAEGIRFVPEEESQEGYLVGRTRLAMVMPLALPEWRTAAVGGSLHQQEGSLVHTREFAGRRLYAPLFFALERTSLRQQRTWRQLTVAGDRQVKPHDEAVGYRIQIGKQQFLAYRSLAENANRSVLGQNLSSEFLMARFLRDGTVEEILEIEPDE